MPLEKSYCCKCGKPLAATANAVLAHYESAHFSDYANNREVMKKVPKAFVSFQEVHKSVTRTIPTTICNPEEVRLRQKNIGRIHGKLENAIDSFPWRRNYDLICDCCKQKKPHGMRVICSQNVRLTLCNTCYATARKGIKRQGGRDLIIYTPMGGQNGHTHH